MTMYYADALSGSDANPGTSTGAAKQTYGGLLSVCGPGDIGYLKNNGTYLLTATAAITAAQCSTSRAAPTIIEGYNTTPGDAPEGAAAPLITTATNSVPLMTYQAGTAFGIFLLRSLRMTNTAATRAAGITGATGAGSVSGQVLLEKVSLSGFTSGVVGASRLAIAAARRTVFRNSTGSGVGSTSVAANALFDECYFIDNAGNGLDIGSGANVINATIRRSVFSGNTLSGFLFAATTRNPIFVFDSNTFEGNGSDGLTFTYTTGVLAAYLRDNVFFGNGGYGVNMSGAGGGSVSLAEAANNAYGSNTSGASQGLTIEVNPISLSGDPFTNAAGEDWAPNATAGRGALLRAGGAGLADIGAIQHADSGGGTVGGPPRVLQPNTWSLVG